jgi:serine/threonine-protein kinase
MIDLLPRLTAALADRYRVERELGAGGMATVYLAHDLRHGRDVAIKVLNPDLAQMLSAGRFAREIHLAARLAHPHILPLFDSGDTAGLLWYAMPVVEGRTLRDRLAQGQPLPVGDAVRLAIEVAGALDFAHRHGVVHRDIKPENILLQDGHALVADFGIGKALGEAADAPSVTMTGISLGTPTYMSPEQAVGEPVDGRSDQYALGCVLFECLTGEPPFTGPTPQAVIAKRFVQTPADVQALREGVPRTVARALQRALQRLPIDRFESAGDFAAALAEMEAPVASARAAPAAPEQSVAVLPFESPAGTEDDGYFADGITEEILTALARHPELKVAGRASCFSFKGRPTDPRVVGEQLGVRTLLEGSVRRSRDRVRITARLTDATDGYQLWSERYDRELEDVFAVQDEIAGTIAGRLRATLAVEAPSRRQRTTTSVEAYEAYLKGKALLAKRGRHLQPGLAQMERALEADPNFALAWAGIAETLALLAYYALIEPTAIRARAREAAERALQHGPDLAEVHAARALCALCLEWDWAGAETAFRRVRALDPGQTQAMVWEAFLFRGSLLADWGGAARLIEAAAVRDPLSVYVRSMQAVVLTADQGGGAGIEAARRAVMLDPDASISTLCAMVNHLSLGSPVEVRQAFAQASATSGRGVTALSFFGLWCAQQGDVEGGCLVLDELCTRAKREPSVAHLRGLLGLLVGDGARAREAFEEALSRRDAAILHLAGSWERFLPALRPLRSHPAVERVLRASGLLAYLQSHQTESGEGA